MNSATPTLESSTLLADLESQINSLTSKLNALEEQISGFQSAPEATGSALALDTSYIIPNTNSLSLDSLTVLGTSSFTSVTTSSLSVTGLTIRPFGTFGTSINSLGLLMLNGVEVDQLGDMKIPGSLSINGYLEAKVLSTTNAGGTVTILAGQTERELKFATAKQQGSTQSVLTPLSTSQILVTPIGKATNVGVQTISNGFKVILPAALDEDLEVQYLILN